MINQSNYSYYCGWNERLAKENFRLYGDNIPVFQLIGETPHDLKRVVMWDFLKVVNNGKFLPNIAQLIGDCTSWGTKKPIDHIAAYQIVVEGKKEQWKECSSLYNYGVSRVLIGGQRGSYEDGSIGEWCSKGVVKFGVCNLDHPKLPKYDSQSAKKYGAEGPPKELQDVGVNHLIKTSALVRNVDEAVKALLNGYCINVCSNRGFQMTGVADKGKLWGRPSGTWNHSMSWVGVDLDSSRPGIYNLNSWGENAHGSPVDDSPPGGFWIDLEVADYMIKQNDTYVYSQFEGYPAQKIDKALFMLYS